MLKESHTQHASVNLPNLTTMLPEQGPHEAIGRALFLAFPSSWGPLGILHSQLEDRIVHRALGRRPSSPLQPETRLCIYSTAALLDAAVDAQCPQMRTFFIKIKLIWTLSDTVLFLADFKLLILGATDDAALFP